MFDYEKVEESEISVSKGQLVSVREVNDSGWCLVKQAQKDGGGAGWIPHDYVEKVDESLVQSVGGGDDVTDAINDLNNKINAAEAKETCFGCKQGIVDKFLVAKEKTFCIGCFNCKVCSDSLAGKPFIEKEEAFYCEDCYYRTFNPPCGACNDVIKGQYITALDKAWHSDCFKCTECSNPFTGNSFRKHENRPYCDGCYNKLFGQACSKCNQMIEGQVFEAMGRKFHLECFTCETGHPIAEPYNFHFYEDKIYCPACFEQLFLQKCSECKQVITEQYVKVGDNHYHPQCWKCGNFDTCGTILDRNNCDQMDGTFYCKPCCSKQVVNKASANRAQMQVSAAKTSTGESKVSAPPAAETKTKRKQAATTSEGPSKKAPVMESKAPEPEGDGSLHFPYSALIKKGAELPPGVESSKKETYLAPDVFKKIFGMDKAAFSKLKLWKRNKLKKANNLF